ncbi:MAG TPA: LamG domain-containing protein [Mycobacteriales bacterium]
MFSHRKGLAVLSVMLSCVGVPLGAGTARAAATPPSPPTMLGFSSSTGPDVCVAGPDRPFLATVTPGLRATVTDPATVSLTFQWSLLDGPVVGEVTTTTLVVGSASQVTIPTGDLSDGQTYSWRVRGNGADGPGPFSQSCEFSVDTTRPDAAPLVTSTDFTENSFVDVLGRSGQVTFDPNGVADVVAFRYTISGAAPVTVATAPGQPVTVRVTPRLIGPLRLKVTSLDRAGGSSPETLFDLFIGLPSGPAGFWRFDEGSGPTVADATGHGHTGTLTGSASWTRGRTGSGLRVHGDTAAVTTAGPVVHTDRNLAVTAWVRLEDRTHTAVAVSQDGVRRSGFTLGYSAEADRWTFSMPRSDTDLSTVDLVTSTAPPEVEVWTLLVGTFDLSSGQIQLYVNGELAGTAAHPAVTDAQGPLRIGQGRAGGEPADTWRGVLDDVRVYDRIVVDNAGTHDIADLVNHPAELTGSWRFEADDDHEPDVSGNQHDGHLRGGVSRIPGLVGNAIALDGATGFMATDGPAVRTDRSFSVSAWVRLDRADRSATVVGQDGMTVSGFRLEYRADLGSWNFRVPVADATIPPGDDAMAFSPVEPGVWTHLAAVYDRPAGLISLFVNGSLEGQTSHVTPWRADGDLVVGRGLDAGQPTDFLAGDVDEVTVYQGALTQAEIGQLATPPDGPVATP